MQSQHALEAPDFTSGEHHHLPSTTSPANGEAPEFISEELHLRPATAVRRRSRKGEIHRREVGGILASRIP
jgi:hypothetical protein